MRTSEFSRPRARSSDTGSNAFVRLPITQRLLLAAALFALATMPRPLAAQSIPNLSQATTAFQTGDYAQAISDAKHAVELRIWNEGWYLLGLQASMATGDAKSAEEFLALGLEKFATSVQMRWWGAVLYAELGRQAEAKVLRDEIADLAQRAPWRYSDRANRTTLARYFLSQGADPKSVLSEFLDRVKSQDPRYVDAYLATAELAIDKGDYELAAEELQTALEIAPERPDLHWRLGQAYLPSNSKLAIEAWQSCLNLNPRFVPCLLSLVDRSIDAEDDEGAIALLDQVAAINPREPRIAIYRSLMSHLAGDFDESDRLLEQALEMSPNNPELLFLLGRKLSQKYRFREGVKQLQRAIEWAPDHPGIQLQLGQDLLRLGDDQGWTLIERVREADPYQVTAYNLSQLQIELASYETIESPPFIVRMTKREAALYGDEVIDLLHQAHSELGRRYDFELANPVLVEIFSRPSDFAVRTFGVPGTTGYLGVCFGHLITISGPASHSPPSSSWKAVLWHEFTHTVTLGKSAHRIPRWLSEGISVREEGVRDSTWMRRSQSDERLRILNDEAPTVSQLSELFLRPQTPSDIDFAYFLAGWVVEYLVESEGEIALRDLLSDLSIGMQLEEALGRRWGSLASIDDRFAEYSRVRALREGLLDADLETHFAALEFATPPSDLEAELLQARRATMSQVQEANEAAERGDLDAAIDLWASLDKSLPSDTDRTRLLTVLLDLTLRSNSAADQLTLINRIVGLGNWQRELIERGIEQAIALQRSHELETLSARLFELDPLLPKVHQLRLAVANEQTDHVSAIRSLKRLQSFESVNGLLIQLELAEQLIATQQWLEAEEELIELVLQAPRSPQVWKLYREVRNQLAETPTIEVPPAPLQ